jgi:periplasmic divalent cation tolerance protein
LPRKKQNNRQCKPQPARNGGLYYGWVMPPTRIVLSTAGTQEEARKIAHALVERKLAACVNIVPQIESIYRWQGKVESATEWLLIVKTTAQAFDRVREAIKELHSYDLPECVMIELNGGSEDYLKWVAESVE